MYVATGLGNMWNEARWQAFIPKPYPLLESSMTFINFKSSHQAQGEHVLAQLFEKSIQHGSCINQKACMELSVVGVKTSSDSLWGNASKVSPFPPRASCSGPGGRLWCSYGCSSWCLGKNVVCHFLPSSRVFSLQSLLWSGSARQAFGWWMGLRGQVPPEQFTNRAPDSRYPLSLNSCCPPPLQQRLWICRHPSQ